MKNISLIGAVIVSIVFLGAACGKKDTNENVNTSSTTSNTITLDSAEVAKHASSNDCWLIISGKVYNVTSFLPRHPGGPEKIIPLCGQDATTQFTTQGGEGTHSAVATAELSRLLLGSLGEELPQ